MRRFILLTATAILFCSAAPAHAQVMSETPVQASDPDAWRYKLHNNQWWYFTPQQQWMYHDGNAWINHGSGAGTVVGENNSLYRGNANNPIPYQSGYRDYYYGNGYGTGYYGNGYNGNAYYGRSYGVPGYTVPGYGSRYGGGIENAIIGRALGGRW